VAVLKSKKTIKVIRVLGVGSTGLPLQSWRLASRSTQTCHARFLDLDLLILDLLDVDRRDAHLLDCSEVYA